MSFELISLLVTLFFLAGIGTPIGYSILLASVVYLGVAGLDVALAGEKLLQGFYRSTILLAVPLFIVAANIMNAGSITDRFLNFCVAAVGRFKGGLGHVNVVASLIF
jgi:TRAP-type mannitol/chloroaromatic compound transport system permease large subunit